MMDLWCPFWCLLISYEQIDVHRLGWVWLPWRRWARFCGLFGKRVGVAAFFALYCLSACLSLYLSVSLSVSLVPFSDNTPVLKEWSALLRAESTRMQLRPQTGRYDLTCWRVPPVPSTETRRQIRYICANLNKFLLTQNKISTNATTQSSKK